MNSRSARGANDECHSSSEKHRLYRRYKKKRCPEAWDKYRQVRNAVASHLKKAKSLFVLNRLADASSHANDLPGNPEESNCNRPRLQTLLRSLLKQKRVDIPDLCDPSQTLPKATTDLGKAELLNQFFISQSRQSASPGAVPPIRTPRSPLVLDRFQVSYRSKLPMDCGQSTLAKHLVLMGSHLSFYKW